MTLGGPVGSVSPRIGVAGKPRPRRGQNFYVPGTSHTGKLFPEMGRKIRPVFGKTIPNVCTTAGRQATWSCPQESPSRSRGQSMGSCGLRPLPSMTVNSPRRTMVPKSCASNIPAPTSSSTGNGLLTPELYLNRLFSQVEAGTRSGLKQVQGVGFYWGRGNCPFNPGGPITTLARIPTKGRKT